MDSSSPTPAQITSRLSEAGDHWWHSIDLGHGIITKGTKPKDLLDREIQNLFLPDLTGKTFLDIGAWDGAMSFEAERLGARRVVALDHYVWSMDFSAQQRAISEAGAVGRSITRWEDDPNVWHPDTLPGKTRFDLAHWALESKVEALVADFMTVDPAELGEFDISLFAGVLYHLPDPISGLRQLAKVTKELAILETEMVHVAGYSAQPLWHYVEGDSMAGDPSNYWLPSKAGLAAALRDAGFPRVEFMEAIGDAPVLSPAGKVINSVSGWAKRTARSLRPSAPANYRQVIHAYK